MRTSSSFAYSTHLNFRMWFTYTPYNDQFVINNSVNRPRNLKPWGNRSDRVALQITDKLPKISLTYDWNLISALKAPPFYIDFMKKCSLLISEFDASVDEILRFKLQCNIILTQIKVKYEVVDRKFLLKWR